MKEIRGCLDIENEPRFLKPRLYNQDIFLF